MFQALVKSEIQKLENFSVLKLVAGCIHTQHTTHFPITLWLTRDNLAKKNVQVSPPDPGLERQ